MATTDTALAVDWLGVCRRAAQQLDRLLAGVEGIDARAAETGERGAGGDRTLVLDRSAEDIVFAELTTLHEEESVAFTAISEERGEQRFGGGALRVVIDPIDGSLNAKREALHYALSIAVADGPTMADVAFAFVHDFGGREQWWARRGEGAWRAPVDAGETVGEGVRLDPTLGARHDPDGRLEIVGIEATDPRRVRAAGEALADAAYRLRAVGSIAVTLCQVAAARFDGMVTLRRSRGVDAAAGQLIVREGGGVVAFPECPSPLDAPLDATASSRLVAARCPEGLAMLTERTR